jgi:hypothetical protein
MTETVSSFTLDPKVTAVVLIEYQNEFTTEGGKLHDAVKECMGSTQMMTHSIQLVQSCREAGCYILHCPISFHDGHAEISNAPYGILKGVKDGAAFTAGTWGAEICEPMQPQPTDLIVKGKSGLCGFQVHYLLLHDENYDWPLFLCCAGLCNIESHSCLSLAVLICLPYIFSFSNVCHNPVHEFRFSFVTTSCPECDLMWLLN